MRGHKATIDKSQGEKACPFQPRSHRGKRLCTNSEALPSSWASSLQDRESNFPLFISQLAGIWFFVKAAGKSPRSPRAASVSLLPLRLEAHGRPGVYVPPAPGEASCSARGSESEASHFPKLPFPNPITFCASALPGQMQPGPG